MVFGLDLCLLKGDLEEVGAEGGSHSGAGLWGIAQPGYHDLK